MARCTQRLKRTWSRWAHAVLHLHPNIVHSLRQAICLLRHAPKCWCAQLAEEEDGEGAQSARPMTGMAGTRVVHSEASTARLSGAIAEAGADAAAREVPGSPELGGLQSITAAAQARLAANGGGSLAEIVLLPG